MDKTVGLGAVLLKYRNDFKDVKVELFDFNLVVMGRREDINKLIDTN